MLDYAEHDLLAQVAAMYYVEEMTQDAIAAQLGLSRVKVYRLLKQARTEQVIQFTINWPVQRAPDAEALLCSMFGLHEALVLKPGSSDRTHTLARVGQLGARFLEQTLRDGMTLTVCLGRSTYEVIHAVRPGFQGHVNVVQAVGSIALATPELDSASLTRELATKLGGTAHYLSAPMVVDTVEASEMLRSQRDIQRSLEMARGADVALVGVGNLDPATSEFAKAGYLSADDLTQIRVSGGIGDMSGQIFTAEGAPYTGGFNERVIGLRLDDLRTIPTVMSIAIGEAKTQAIFGALRTGVIDVFCTDLDTASAVLQLENRSADFAEEGEKQSVISA
ncbi:MAG: sugar-binding domain-containing protein [Caldilinea sp.]